MNKLNKISNSLLDNHGNLKSFKKQLVDYKNDLLTSGVELIILKNSKCLEYANVKNYPIVISQNTIKKITIGKHKNLNRYIVNNLDTEIKNSVLAMDSITHSNSRVIVLNKFNLIGNPIIAILYINKSNAKLKINEIVSVYDKKEFQKFINNTIKANKNIYTNEKTEHWLLMSGLQLPIRFIKSSDPRERVTQ